MSELGDEGGHVGEAPLGVDLEAASEQTVEPARGPVPRRGDERAGEDVAGEVDGGLPREGASAVERLEERGAEGELVAARVDMSSQPLLWGHVRRSPDDEAVRAVVDPGRALVKRLGGAAAAREAQGAPQAGDAEIHDDDAAVVADEDIVGLEVSDRPNSVA